MTTTDNNNRELKAPWSFGVWRCLAPFHFHGGRVGRCLSSLPFMTPDSTSTMAKLMKFIEGI
jgi:hypothetical protein